MDEVSLFEKAVRAKLRFTYRGVITTEDLWDVPLTGLDAIHKVLKVEARKQDEESLLSTKSSEDTLLNLKIAVVTYVFNTLVDERDARKSAADAHAYKKKIDAIIANKQDAALLNLPIEELQKLREGL